MERKNGRSSLYIDPQKKKKKKKINEEVVSPRLKEWTKVKTHRVCESPKLLPLLGQIHA